MCRLQGGDISFTMHPLGQCHQAQYATLKYTGQRCYLRRYIAILLSVCLLFCACEKASPPVQQSSEVAEKQADERYEFEQRVAEVAAKKTAGSKKAAGQSQAIKQDPVPDADKDRKLDAVAKQMMTRQVTTRSAELQSNAMMETADRLSNFAPSSLQKKIQAALQAAADKTLMKRQSHWRVRQTQEWKQLTQLIKPLLARVKPRRKASKQKLQEILMVALVMMERDDEYERAVGYSLVHHVLELLGDRAPKDLEKPYIRSMAARLSLARSVDERTLLMETALSNDRTGHLFTFGVATALTDTAWQVRAKTLEGLKVCAERRGRCRLAPVMLNLLYETHEDTRTRGALIQYAGVLKYDRVVEWCRKPVEGGPLALPCRDALGALQSRRAFDVLFEWLQRRKDDPKSLRAGNYGFRDEFRSIMAYANSSFARMRFTLLVSQVLGQNERDGFATGGIVRMLDQMDDAIRAEQILTTSRDIYQAYFKGRTLNRSQQFLLRQLDRMLQKLKPKVAAQREQEEKKTIRTR